MRRVPCPLHALDLGARDLPREFLRVNGRHQLAGTHGKTYRFVGFDEIHGYKTWDVLEALQPDPTRTDHLTWITSYAGIDPFPLIFPDELAGPSAEARPASLHRLLRPTRPHHIGDG